ncbi:MAG: class I SAM-dependent methyltransferase [Flavobacteriaceae bacterium]|nr:class I SAM-dependent methyltransferase [Flavobacteriaceae bacterium]
MDFYQSIAPYYHHIFKISQPQIDFIKAAIPENEKTILEIGCGIGTLSFELASIYQQVISIDFDAEMIVMARSNSKNNTAKTQFSQMNMLYLDANFDKNSLDGIICFGNTLVHLSSLEQVSDFLLQAKSILKSDGKLLLQIVNYDRILAQQIKELPLIENDEIKFERNYAFHSSAKLIDFNTILTVKSTHQKIENRLVLLPILQEELQQLLTETDFKNQHFYGNFLQQPFDFNSPALVVEAW